MWHSGSLCLLEGHQGLSKGFQIVQNQLWLKICDTLFMGAIFQVVLVYQFLQLLWNSSMLELPVDGVSNHSECVFCEFLGFNKIIK